MKRRMAAELLVQSLLQEETATVMVKDSSGVVKNQFAVPNPQDLAQIEQLIDDNGGIPFGSAEEKAVIAKVSPENNLAGLRRWINRTEFSSIKQDLVDILTRAIHEETNEVFRLFSSISDLSSLAGAGESRYEQNFMLRLSTIKINPKQRGLSTGEGEIAIAFLCGTVPAQTADYDFVKGKAEYSVKSNLDNISVYRQTIKPNLRSDQDFLSSSRANKAIKALGLTSKATAARTKKGRKRYAVVCQATTEAFKFKVFSISDIVFAELGNESRGVSSTTPKITIDPSYSNIKVHENKIAATIIAELSRRDQQDVEAIARRVAQQVLQDELGDDFDKAVRREMLVSLKDKEVESGVADVSRDFMRKFYRSLGTASSSPLDKVKV